uniref:Uncharacterized protein n=1 Tax=viral metagenome TaxID=1070528 RepID=A0A6H1ZHI5_9ZZZZ
MRTLTSTLEAAQQSSGVKALVRLALSLGETSYTYYAKPTGGRIFEVTHTLKPFNHKATVMLKNADNVLSGIDLKGYDAVIGWGTITSNGEEYSDDPLLMVRTQGLYSAQGKSICDLNLIGVPNLLVEDRASASYIPVSSDTKTVKDLIREIAGDTGVTMLACYNHCRTYTVVFDSEDALLDTYIPADSFRIYINGSRLAAIRRLLDYTKCMIKWDSSGNWHILVPKTRRGL